MTSSHPPQGGEASESKPRRGDLTGLPSAADGGTLGRAPAEGGEAGEGGEGVNGGGSAEAARTDTAKLPATRRAV